MRLEPDHEARQRRLRERVLRLAGLGEESAPPADVVVSHCEVCEGHGTGVLTKRIFGGAPGILSVRSRDQYGGRQAFGDEAFLLAHPAGGPPPFRGVLSAFADHDVRRIVCIPYFRDDAETALALAELFGAPLCTYVMDDSNDDQSGIPDALVRELLRRSRLRLAISGELRDAYERKFGLPFHVLPPLVEPSLVLREPSVPPPEALLRRRGVVVGNIWGPDWLAQLRRTLRAAKLEVDWYCNSGTRWLGVSPEDLAADGVHLHPALPERELTPLLRRTPFAVLPSGTLDASDSRRAIAELSLPSKVPYVSATSHTPWIILGSPATTAARFVTARGLGVSVPYEAGPLLAAVAEVCTPEAQARMRAAAARLAPAFSAEGAREWIWRSLAAGRAVDDRFERLAPRPAGSAG